MVTDRVQDAELFAGHSPDQERPLGSYAVLTGVFLTLTTAFLAWIRASGRELPERVTPGDLALITVATHKASRLIAKDRVTSAVRAPFTASRRRGPGEVTKRRGAGAPRAIGELVICPYCLGLWIAAVFAAGLVVAPGDTMDRLCVTALFGADLLQIA